MAFVLGVGLLPTTFESAQSLRTLHGVEAEVMEDVDVEIGGVDVEVLEEIMQPPEVKILLNAGVMTCRNSQTSSPHCLEPGNGRG